MTRTRNATFHGTTGPEADVDAKDYARVPLEAQQDFNRLYDLVTGENGVSSSDTIIHNGESGRGSLLGFPLHAQTLERTLRLWVPAASDPATIVSTYGGDVVIGARPLFIPQGEYSQKFAMRFSQLANPLVWRILDSGGAVVDEGDMAPDDSGEGELYTVTFGSSQFAAPGRYYLEISTDIDNASNNSIMRRVKIWPGRFNPNYSPDTTFLFNGGNSPFPVPVAGAGVPVDVETIHDEMLVAQYAHAGWLLSKFNRNLNAFWEYVRGVPVPGNAALANADTSDTNPTTSRFWANTRAGFASEPLIEVPIFGEFIGAFRKSNGASVVDSAHPPTEGMLDYFAPYPVDLAASTGHKMTCYLPDFRTSTSDFKVAPLFVNENGKGTPTNWECRVLTPAGGSAWVNLTQLGSTRYYVPDNADGAVLNALPAVPFTPDDENEIALQMRNLAGGAAYTHGEIALVGWEAYFDS